MAQIDGGEMVARTLKQEGIDCIFTLCGGHVMNIYNGCLNQGIRVVDVRHEQAAGHAAEGWSRVTRRPGVAVVTAGPGVTDAVTAVANAYQNRSPLVLIAGAAPLSQWQMGGLQEMEQVDLMKPITKWAGTVHQTRRIPEYLQMCFRIAMTGRYGPCFLEIPSDVLFGRLEEGEIAIAESYRSEGRVQGDQRLVAQATALLDKAERPVVMAGSQVYWSDAADALRQLIERLRSPVYLNAMGRGSIRQEHPLFFSRTRRAALSEADVVLVIGTPLDFRLRFGRAFSDQSKIIQVDVDPTEIGRNRPFDIGIEGDAGAVLKQMLDELGDPPAADHETGGWVKGLREKEDQVREMRQQWLHSDAIPIHPLRLCHEMAGFVDDDTLVVGDGGDIVNLAAQILPINHPGQWFDPGPMGTLGVGTGFCMAAKIARPEKKILMVNGDGSFGLNGFEFDTFVRHNLPVVSVVGNDRQWGQITVGQVKMYGRERAVASVLGDNAHYERVVEALGGHGEFVTEPAQIRPAIERAFASGKPACVNVITDPEPPGVHGGYEFM
jgi:acetolactate synthase-1/2/3 large subunit